jgi:hypothetical protein
MSDWINGDTTVLRAERLTEWTQRAIGSGKVFAYIEKEKLNHELILNQSKEHYLSVIQIAAYFIERNIKVEVNHYEDVDVVAWLLDGPVAFEYQTSGYNDPKRLTEKRKTGENKYGRLFFVGNTHSVKEVALSIETDKIVIPRGTRLEEKIKELLGEKTIQDE